MLDPCYDCYEPAIDLAGAPRGARGAGSGRLSRRTGTACAPRSRRDADADDQQPAQPVRRDARRAATCATLADDRCATPASCLLSDEVYEHIVFDGAPPRIGAALSRNCASARSSCPASARPTTAPAGRSATASRRRRCRAEFRKVHQYNTFCTLRPGAAGVRGDDRAASRSTTSNSARSTRPSATASREQLLSTRLKPLPVPGGYFQLVDYSAVSDLDDAAFCRWLTIEKGVAAIPLSPFYEAPPRRPAPGAAVLRQERGDAGRGDRAPARAVTGPRCPAC